jgi:hypothetical protein
MAWFGLFNKKKVRKKSTRKSVSNKSQVFKAKFDKLEAEIKTIHLLLQNHDQTLNEHTQVIGTHTGIPPQNCTRISESIIDKFGILFNQKRRLYS